MENKQSFFNKNFTSLLAPPPEKVQGYKEVLGRDREKKLKTTRKKGKVSKVILVIVLILYAVVSLYPFVWSFIVSFINPNRIPEVGLSPFVDDAGWTTDNYTSFFESSLTKDYAGSWISNSIIYSVSNATINCFFNFLAGYALARIHFRAKGAMTWYIIVALMVPVQATQIPQLVILMQLGFINFDTPNSIWFIGILSTGMTSGVLIFMVRQFYINQSASIEEAGLIDGLSRFQVFLRISLKSMLPLLATQWAMVFIGSWNNFILFTLWASGIPDRMTLTSAFRVLSQSRFGLEGQGRTLAAANISVAPVLLVYMVSLRFQRKVMVDGEK